MHRYICICMYQLGLTCIARRYMYVYMHNVYTHTHTHTQTHKLSGVYGLLSLPLKLTYADVC